MFEVGYKHRLNYSLGNETWLAESQALGIEAGDSVLCITASGDRCLHTLLDDPSCVVALDSNPIQNYLLELKIAALCSLGYEQFRAFLGCESSSTRVPTFLLLQHRLSLPARNFWNKNLGMIRRGVLFQGKTERYCLFVSRFLRVLFGSKASMLLAFDDIEAQRRFVEQVWDTGIHRWVYRLSVCMPKIPGVTVFDDPGLREYVDDAIDPARYMYEQQMAYLQHDLAKSSLLLQLLYRGELLEPGLPAYLREENYAIIRSRVERITIVTADLCEYLQQFQQSYDVFSFSDIASYMPYLTFVQTLAAAKRRARPGARFCIREYMTRYGIPEQFVECYVRDPLLERCAEDLESNFVYRIMAGRISSS